MAKIEKTIELNVESGGAQADFGKLADAIQELNKSFSKFSQTTDKGLDDISKTSKKTEKGVGGISKGFKGLGLAMKAAGIGLIISALTSLKEVFSQNQKVVDVFSTAFETFSIVANQLVNAVINIYEAVAKSSENFNGLSKVLGSLITLGITPLKLGFYAVQLALKTAQLAWEESFFGDKDPETIKRLNAEIKETSGNIEEVAVDALEAGKDIATNIGDAVSEVANIGKVAGEELGKISIKNASEQAKLNVQLSKSAELAAVRNQGLIEKYDRQAELLRQTRDDESKGIEERIKANKDLAKVLDDQEKAMKSNAAIAVKRAQVELDKNKGNIELQKAYQEALNEQAGIEAQITGFRSEQQTNTNSLLREQKDLQNELALIGKSQRDIEREELAQELELKKELINREVTDVTERNALLLAAKTEYNTQLLNLNAEFDAEDLAAKKETAAASADIAQKESDAKQKALDAYAGALSTISGVLGQETEAGKSIAIASSLVNTYASIAGQLNAFSGVPVPGYAIAQAIATGVVGFANVKKIASVKIPNSKGGVGGASGSLPSAGAASQPPSFNIVGASETNQLADAIGGQAQEPVQAYVVSNDVTTAQSLQNNIVEGATIGG
jgi:hypothetical protein